ncbi:MAG: hypothetical protein AB1847_13585 [bacterium]
MEKKAVIKNGLTKKIIHFELLGFGIVILLLWLDEVIDLPHLCGAPATPTNLAECLFETFYVWALGVFVIIATWRFLKRIKYLEGFLRVCTFCKRIRVGNEWIPIEHYIQDHSEAEFSHGLCEQCMEKHYGVKVTEE